MFNSDYSLVNKVLGMVEESVWVAEKLVRPRISCLGLLEDEID